MDESRVMLNRVCPTCRGTGTIRHRRAFIGRPGGGPRRIVRVSDDEPIVETCPECKGKARHPVYRA